MAILEPLKDFIAQRMEMLRSVTRAAAANMTKYAEPVEPETTESRLEGRLREIKHTPPGIDDSKRDILGNRVPQRVGTGSYEILFDDPQHPSHIARKVVIPADQVSDYFQRLTEHFNSKCRLPYNRERHPVHVGITVQTAPDGSGKGSKITGLTIDGQSMMKNGS